MSTKFEKLDPEFKKKWIEALRSGKYKQGRHCLGDSERGYCCLGVASLIVGDRFPAKRTTPIFSQNLPSCLKIRADGSVSPEVSVLEKMNDGDIYSHSYTFTQIADWIEQNL